MSSISVIGSGSMGSAIGALARGRRAAAVGVGRHGAGNYNFSLGVKFG